MNRIKEIRTALGLSLEKVAKGCVPPTTPKQIQRLEKGERKLTTQWMKRLKPILKAEPHEMQPEVLSVKLKKLIALYDSLSEQDRRKWLGVGEIMKGESPE